MIWIDEKKLSNWAFMYCKDIEDDPEVKKFITYSYWAFMYCRDINDDPEIRKHITESKWAYKYCKDINDDPELRKHITKSNWAYWYCREINDDPEVKKYIIETDLILNLKRMDDLVDKFNESKKQKKSIIYKIKKNIKNFLLF